MNPLGRTNDKPENPLDDVVKVPVPLNAMPPAMRSPDTLAQKRDSFLSREGAVAEQADGSAGPDGPITRPGGNNMMNDFGAFKGTGAKMQYSREQTDEYQGKAVYGAIIKGDSSQVENYEQDSF